MSYDKLWTAYKTTDVYPTGHANAGKIWDMYSDCIFTAGGSGSGGQCGTYSNECDCYNREHSMPKSWFNESKPAYYDLGHIVPTDGKVNGIRSNYAFGEVGTSTKTFSHSASKFGTAKAVTTTNVKGTSTITTSYTGTVYEPDDQYKGDFARMYMYMRVRYKTMSITTGDGSLMFNSTDANYGMTDYSIALLMKWHRQDPVSQKEIDRNNGMQSVQGNRNPFIDYPALAEYLWGSKAGETFKFADVVASFDSNFEVGVSDGFNNSDPAISSPSGTINVGSTSANTPLAQTIKVQGRNLTSGNLTLALSGANSSLFSLSTTSISKANAEAGQNITITYSPTANGTHTATLTISGCGVTSHTVTLNGTCETLYIVNWRSDEGLYNTNTAASNGKPTLPEDPDACDATRVFVGWTLQAGYNNTTTAPTDLFTESSGAINITKDTTFYAVYADADNNGGSASSQSYTFTTSSWGDSSNSWTSNTAGAGYSNSGVQVTTGASGANATCKTSFSNVSSAVVSYCTNASKGAGTIVVNINGTEVSQSVSTSGGTTARNLTFDFSSTTPTGAPTITVNCTTNSIYVCGITINYGSGATYSNYSTQCATGPTATITFHANGGSGTMEAQTVSQNKNTSLHTNEFTREGYTFAGWATTANGEVAFEDEETINTDSNLDLYAKWTALAHYTVTWHVDGKTKAVDYIEETALNLDTVPQNCSEDRVFMGWTAHSGYSSEDTEPDDLFTTASGTVTANADYYAIFADKETSGSGSQESYAFSTLALTDATSVDEQNISIGTNSSITFNKGTNNNTPKYYSGHIRLYGGSYCVVSSTSGNISQIVFTFSSGEGSNAISVDAGSYADGTWTGDASSVKFTVGGSSGHRRFASVAVTIGGGSSTTYSNYNTSCGATTKYTITWDAATNGGSCTTATTKVTAGQAVGTLPVATKDHASFEGWFDAASGGTEITASTVPTGDITYYAQFTAEPTYTVTFMNGSEVHHTQTNYAGTTITLPGSNPSPCSGYSAFAGWASSEQVSETTTNPVVATPTTIPAENKTYYAVFSRTENSGSGGSATLTQQGSSSTFSAGDNIVIVAKGTSYALYQETANSSYVNKWTFENSASTVGADAKNYLTLTATGNNWYIGDATNGYIYTSGSNNLSCSTDNQTAWTIAWNSDNSAFTIVGNSRYLSCRTDLTNDYKNYYRLGGTGTGTGIAFFDIYKYVSGGGSSTTYYTTNCCSATITVQTSDTAKGTVSVE